MHTSQLAHHTSERPETPENGHRAFQAAPPTGWPGDFRDLWDCTRGCPGDWRGGREGHGDLSMTFPVTSRVTHAGDPGSRAEFRRRRPATRQTVSGSPRKGPCELLDLSFSPPGSPGCNLKGPRALPGSRQKMARGRSGGRFLAPRPENGLRSAHAATSAGCRGGDRIPALGTGGSSWVPLALVRTWKIFLLAFGLAHIWGPRWEGNIPTLAAR